MKLGFVTITGVLGVTEIEGGELLGVIRSTGSDSDALDDGDTGTSGARSSGWVVGIIPLTEGVLDIHRGGAGRIVSKGALVRFCPGVFGRITY